ncbi:hypothetical protein STEG23_007143, partial [Scotinomys teguina]
MESILGSTYGEGGLHSPSLHWSLLECISPSLVFGTFSRRFGPPWIHLKSCQPKQYAIITWIECIVEDTFSQTLLYFPIHVTHKDAEVRNSKPE